MAEIPFDARSLFPSKASKKLVACLVYTYNRSSGPKEERWVRSDELLETTGISSNTEKKWRDAWEDAELIRVKYLEGEPGSRGQPPVAVQPTDLLLTHFRLLVDRKIVEPWAPSYGGIEVQTEEGGRDKAATPDSEFESVGAHHDELRKIVSEVIARELETHLGGNKRRSKMQGFVQQVLLPLAEQIDECASAFEEEDHELALTKCEEAMGFLEEPKSEFPTGLVGIVKGLQRDLKEIHEMVEEIIKVDRFGGPPMDHFHLMMRADWVEKVPQALAELGVFTRELARELGGAAGKMKHGDHQGEGGLEDDHRTTVIHESGRNDKWLSEQERRITQKRLWTTFLTRYYDPPAGWAHFQFRLPDDDLWMEIAAEKGWDDGWRPVEVVTRQDWLNLRVPMPLRDIGEFEESCRRKRLRPAYKSTRGLGDHIDRVGEVLPEIDQNVLPKDDNHPIIEGEKGWWNGHTWLLSDVNFDNGLIEADFYEGRYFAFLKREALLETELSLALAENVDLQGDGIDVGAVLERSDALLPLRMRLLPDGDTLVDYSGRACFGGICVTIASRKGDGYRIHYQDRSGGVAEKRWMMEALPAAIHTRPRLPLSDHVFLSDIVLFETAEEVFGDEMEKRLKKPKDVERPRRWFLDKYSETLAPLKTAIAREGSGMYCTGLEIHQLNGKYEFGILLLLEDEEFWNGREPSSEIVRWDSTDLGNRRDVVETLAEDEWAGGGLFSLINALLALKELRDVDIPVIEVRPTPLMAGSG